MEAQALPPDAATGRTPLDAVSGRAMLSSRALRLATDAHLVKLVRQGEVAAFEAIYDRYHRAILSHCRHVLADREEAADVVQHTFLAAYTAIISSEKPILLRAWLYTIARNRCFSVLRARRQEPTGEVVEPFSEGLTTHVLRREDLRQLLIDMRRLPEDQRAALVLAGLGTLNHEEIAAKLGVPPAKVKALVFQAREALVAARKARETDCSEIREQLATLSGGALRRGNLRRHLRDCPACREFSAEMAGQRERAKVMPMPRNLGPGESRASAVAAVSAMASPSGLSAALRDKALRSQALSRQP